MKKLLLHAWLIAAGVLFALVLAACAPKGVTTTGKGQALATQTPASGRTPASSATATSTQPGGSPGGTLPSDIPAYPGARFLNERSQGNTTFYFYSSTDSPPKIFQFYQQEMPQNGWTAVKEPVPSTDPLGVYTKGQRSVMFQFTLPGAPVNGHPTPTTFSIIVTG